MDRRSFVTRSSAALAGLSAAGVPLPAQGRGSASAGDSQEPLNVAFVISDNANVIDLAGAWEVFQDTMIHADGGHRHPFRLYTVSERLDVVRATAGLQIVPDFRLADAPPPHVVSVGAQAGSSAIHEWIRTQHRRADVLLMSVCTGAFQLARAGVLAGRRATTHHDFWDSFEEQHPDVTLVRGRRFVGDGDIVTAGGLTSGIDAALHVVARLHGSDAAARTADYMEYDSRGWRDGARTPG